MNWIQPARRLSVVLSLLSLGACSGDTPSDGPSPGDALLIGNVTLIDGTDNAPLEDAAILIRDGRITWIGLDDAKPAVAGVRIYDGRGAYVIPGLWDMHTHVLWQPFVEDGYLQLFLVNGVTGIRDMGGTLEVLQAVRPGGQYHSPLNPRIVASGPWLNSFEIDPRAGITVESPDDARKAVASLADGGVDFIKVYLHLPREVFLAILEEAQVRDLPVAGHVPLEIDSMEASELGMRSIEHMRSEIGGFCAELAPDECASLLAVFRENNTWQTPTLLVRRNRAFFDRPEMFEESGLRHAPPYLREEWDEIRLRRLEQVDFAEVRKRYADEQELAGMLYEAQLPILAGTDSGDVYCVPGFSIHEELALLVDAGLTERDALRAATTAPVEYLGLTDSLGSIAEGKIADFVLLEANPLEDIRNTRRVRAVVRNGRLYDRAELDEILERLSGADAVSHAVDLPGPRVEGGS